MGQQSEIFPWMRPVREIGHDGKVRGPQGGKRYIQPRGYAARPGTGPAAEKCRTCDHYRHVNGGSRAYPKCGLMEPHWTHGPSTDIRANAEACEHFEKRDMEK